MTRATILFDGACGLCSANARNRYRWFRRRDVCALPTREQVR